MIETKDVTIIIPHLGGTMETEYALAKCLKSLQQTVPDIKKITAYNNFEGWDGPVPSNAIFLQEQGQNKAVNAAVATTNTPWVFVTNDDMVYPLGWFERLQKGMTEEMLCISPMLIEPRPGAPTFQVFFAGGAGGDFDKKLWEGYAEEHYEREWGIRTGFNLPLLIRRDLWDLVGGYDINYDPWGSNGDSDLLYKIRLAGIQPYQNQNSIVYHFSQTSGTFNPANDSYRFLNYAYFKEKWGFDRTDNRIWEADFIMPTKEEGRIFLPEWEGKYGN